MWLSIQPEKDAQLYDVYFNQVIAVPWNESEAVLERGSWSMLSTSPVMIKPLFNFLLHTIPIFSYPSQVLSPKLADI